MTFTEKIEKLLASNYLKEVIDEFLKFLNEVPHSNTDAKNDSRQLRGQIIVLSGRFTELDSKMTTNTIDSGSANQEKSAIINSFIQILNQMPSNYPDLNNYLEEKNEEDEWKDAQKKNTIEEYHDYFNKYPNGKYKADTIKLITELEEVKAKQEMEMKRLASLEKERRANDKTQGEPTKVAMGSGFNQAFQTTDKTSSASAAPVYQTTAPVHGGYQAPKSRTGLYIALGVLIGIVFIIIIAVAVSGDDVTPAVNEQVLPIEGSDQNTYEKDPSTQSFIWPANEEYTFMFNCEAKAIEGMDSETAKVYCDCVLQKLKKTYRSAVDAEAVLGEKGFAQFAIECIPDGMKQ